MKKMILSLAIACPAFVSFAQQKYFEGSLTYQVTVKSKVQGLSDKDAAKIFATGSTMTVSIKNGNYRHTTSNSETIYSPKDQRVYLKFRKFDTLYYLAYASDTSEITGVTKSDTVFKVLNRPCKEITLKSAANSWRYYYSDSLRVDPSYDVNNTVAHFNTYSKETNGAIYLWIRIEYPFAEVTDSCIRIEQKNIDDHVFDLPSLPIKKSLPALAISARFPGKADAWAKYLEASLDSKLSLKYVKLPKGQDEASETAIVKFTVGEDGSVSDITVVNKNDVQSRLAEEAMRVIKDSPRWIPATFFGEKITSTVWQSIVFKVTR